MLPLAEFAYNNARHSSTQVSPFFANQGWHPRLTFNKDRTGKPLDEPAAAAHANRMSNLFRNLQDRLEDTQISAAKYYDRRRKTIEFQVGDHVWLRTTNISTGRQSRKLQHKKIGPYSITRVIVRNDKVTYIW